MRSSPQPKTATRIDHVPAVWNKATCRCRHAKEFLLNRLWHLETRTNRRCAGRSPTPAEPAAPTHSCPDACRSGRPRARREHPTGPGSSPLQYVEDAPQRFAVDGDVDADAASVWQLDLNPSNIGPSNIDPSNIGGSKGAGVLDWWIAGNRYRQQCWFTCIRRAQQSVAIEPAPEKHLVRIHVVSLRYNRRRRPSLKRRRDNLALQLVSPSPAPMPTIDRVHYRVRGHFHPTRPTLP